VSTILQTVFEEEGIRVVTNDRLASVSKNDNGTHTALTVGGTAIVGELLLVSIGRTPNTQGLGLEKIGVQIKPMGSTIAGGGGGGGGGIIVNDRLETTCKGLYAAGDCTGDKQFTHYAGYQGAIAARNILLPLSDPGVLSNVPACTFTSPEVASLGLSEQQARNEYGDSVVGVSKMNLDDVDRALCEGHRHGILKVMYHKRNGKILGATIMAPAAGELISEIAVARAAGMTFDALAKVIHPYPSYAMALQLMAADVYYEKTTNLLWLYNCLKWIGL
jgi:pyruvate/2-oxoglutarate dehydrogenase complex dihydrolipoamide dehydrogenase (E3) component